MEKHFCLTSFWVILPVCGAGGLCLMDGFAPFGFLSHLQIIAQFINSLSTGDHRSTF
jgi:hypothetical protein